MIFFARRRHVCYRNDGIFFINFGDGEVSEKFPLRGLPFARLTGWGGPLVKARPCKVKGVDPVVKRDRVRQDGGTGG